MATRVHTFSQFLSDVAAGKLRLNFRHAAFATPPKLAAAPSLGPGWRSATPRA